MNQRDEWQAIADVLDEWPTGPSLAVRGDAVALASVDETGCVHIDVEQRAPIP